MLRVPALEKAQFVTVPGITEEFMNTLDTLREIYPFDPQTRTFTILTRLEHYADFFNPMDPSPAPTRDLSADLVDYLNQCSDEILAQYALAIVLELQSESSNPQHEKECLASLRNFYQHEIFVSQAHIHYKRGQALKYLMVSIVCLAVYIFSDPLGLTTFFSSLLREGSVATFLSNLLREAVLIGGWVFMWEAVTLNFIQIDSHFQEIRKYRRLIKAAVTFSYGDAANT
jgi:hypothetical protein